MSFHFIWCFWLQLEFFLMLHLGFFQTFISLSSDYVIVQICSKPSVPSKFANVMQIDTSVLCQGSHQNIFSALYIWSVFEWIPSFQELSLSAQLNIYSLASSLPILLFFQYFTDISETFQNNLSWTAASTPFIHCTTFFLGFLPSGFSTSHKTVFYFLCISKQNWRRVKGQQKHTHLGERKNSGNIYSFFKILKVFRT